MRRIILLDIRKRNSSALQLDVPTVSPNLPNFPCGRCFYLCLILPTYLPTIALLLRFPMHVGKQLGLGMYVSILELTGNCRALLQTCT